MNNNFYKILNLLLLYINSVSFVTHSFAQTGPTYNSVVPIDAWDELSNLPLTLPPNGVLQNCKSFNADVKNSCAASGAVRRELGNNIKDVVDGVLKRMDKTSASQDYNSLQTKLTDVFTEYRECYCKGGKIKACVKKQPSNCAPIAIQSSSQNWGQFKSQIINLAKNTNYNFLANNLYTPASDCNCNQDSFSSQFGIFNKRECKFPTYYKYTNPVTEEKKKAILAALRAETITSSALLRVDYLYSTRSIPAPQPSPNFITKTKVKFKDNDSIIVQGEAALIDEIKKIKAIRLKGDAATVLTYNLDKIVITSSSSTLNNTANYCRKDFANLSKARAQKIKELLLNNFDFEVSKISDPVVGGTDGKGSTGRCAYRCKDSSPSGVCVEERAIYVSASELDDNQKVTIEFVQPTPSPAPATRSTPTPSTLYMQTESFDVSFGCVNAPVYGCFDSYMKDGKVVPSNAIK